MIQNVNNPIKPAWLLAKIYQRKALQLGPFCDHVVLSVFNLYSCEERLIDVVDFRGAHSPSLSL